MIKRICCDLWQHRRPLLTMAAIHRLLGLTLLWPMLGLLLRTWLALYGESTLTDQNIALFLASPLGIAGGLIYATVAIAIGGLEQASLMSLSRTIARRGRLSPRAAILFSLRRARPIVQAALRMAGLTLVRALPFALGIVLVAWGFFRQHDINFYLTQRPSEFWWVTGLGGALVIAMLAVVLPYVVGWVYVLPAMLFEELAPSAALRISSERSQGHRWTISCVLLFWLLLFLGLYWLYAGFLWQLGSWSMPLVRHSLTTLVPSLGLLFMLWAVGNILLSLLQSVSFAMAVTFLYERLAAPGVKWPATSIDHPSAWNMLRAEWASEPVATRFVADEPAAVIGKQAADQAERTTRRWQRNAGAVIVVALLAGSWLMLGTSVKDNPVTVIAHRGASGVAPENTMAAFEQAIVEGADMVELDVQETADGQVVVFHDSDFMKIAQLELKIWNATMDRLAEIDIGSHFNPQFSRERVPLLSEALQLCRNRAIVNIELKYYGHEQQLAQRVIDIVEQVGMEDQVVLMSLKHSAVLELKSLRPDWTVGLLSAVSMGNLTELEADFYAVSTKLATSSLIQRVHKRGKPIYVWTVDEPAIMTKYLSMGVDGLITNRPAVAREVLAQRASMSLPERLLLHFAVRIGLLPRVKLTS